VSATLIFFWTATRRFSHQKSKQRIERFTPALRQPAADPFTQTETIIRPEAAPAEHHCHPVADQRCLNPNCCFGDADPYEGAAR